MEDIHPQPIQGKFWEKSLPSLPTLSSLLYEFSNFIEPSTIGGGFARSSLSLGSAGTRRTVYYTEEETNEDDQPNTTTFVSCNKFSPQVNLAFKICNITSTEDKAIKLTINCSNSVKKVTLCHHDVMLL